MVRDIFVEIHPGIQLFYFIVVIAVSILLPHPGVIGCSFLGALAYSVWLGGWKKALRFQGLYMLPMMVLVIGINGLFSHYGVTPLYYLKTGAVTLEALVYGGILGWMLWTSLIWFSVLNQVFTVERWVYLLGRCTPALSLALAITLRFIPRCKRQFQKIREGRQSLGLEEQGSFRHRIRGGGKQLSMLLTWSLESGIEMADSMRARGYGQGRRTSYGNHRMESRDWLMMAVPGILAAISVWGFACGFGGAYYNPIIYIAAVGKSAGSVITYGGWFLFCFFPAIARCVQELRYRKWERRYDCGGCRDVAGSEY